MVNNIGDVMKLCPSCNTELQDSSFYKDKSKKDGLSTYCKPCRREKTRLYEVENKDKVDLWREKRLREVAGGWHKDSKICPKCKESKSHKEYSKNKGSITGLHVYCKACDSSILREKIAKNPNYYKDMYRDNRDRFRASNRRARIRNRETLIESCKRWRLENRDKHLASVHARRARMLSADGGFSKKDIERLKKSQSMRCASCDTCLIKSGYHIDHITPLSKGGSNWPYNLQLLCPKCNLGKAAMMPSEWERVKSMDV